MGVIDKKLDFKTFVANIDGSIEITDIKNFELWVLCSTAVGYLNKITDISRTLGQPASFSGKVSGYVSHARDYIATIANTESANVEQPLLRPMADRLIGSLNRANGLMMENISKLKVGDYDKEFWWFYSLWLEGVLDSITTPSDSHLPLKTTDGSSRSKHHTKTVFKNGTCKWVYSVRLEDGGRVIIKSFLNGNAMVRDEGFSAIPIINEQEDIVDYVLRHVALHRATEKGFEYAVSLIKDDAKAVAKAKVIASVLGGEYPSYLLTAKYFDESLQTIVSSTMNSKHEAATLILNRELRVSDHEVKQLIERLVDTTDI